MSKKRIVITGLGVVSCFGSDVDLFYQALLRGDSGVRTIDTFPCEDFPTRFAAGVRHFDSSEYLEKKQARRVDPFLAYSIVAGKKALEYAAISPNKSHGFDPQRCGIIIGSGMGGMALYAENIQALIERGHQRVSPFFIPYIITNMASGMLAMDLGFMGPNYAVSTACASGNHAIIAAANHIRHGDADLMVCGGAEAGVNPIALAGFCALKALSKRNDAPEAASRPWDTERDGFVIGEGAGILVLESLEHAEKRGATILAEYLGGAVSCDAHHITEPRSDGAGVILCLHSALNDAGISASRVNYINAHATATQAGDMVEIDALKQVFTDYSSITINATKSMTGHALGASAGLEAVALAKAVATGEIHPTRNLNAKEEGIGFFTPLQAHSMQVDVGLSNAFGFGGHNSAILLTRYNG